MGVVYWGSHRISELRGFLTTQRIFRADGQGQGQWVRLPRGKDASLKTDRAKQFSFLPCVLTDLEGNRIATVRLTNWKK